MTTIAGLTSGGKVLLAADQQVSDGNGYTTLDANKIFRTGHLIMGIAGDYKAVNTLRWMPTPRFEYQGSPHRFMTLSFPRLVREFTEEYELSFGEYEVLIGTKGYLFYYSSDDESVCATENYYAIGTGGPFALGSLATSEHHPSITDRLRKAVQVAIRFDSQSGGGIEFVSP